MTLEEQYTKETGKKSVLEIEIAGVLIDVISEDYTIWLEEKLTWKKFGEQKPESGRKAFIRNGDQIDYVVFKSKKSIDKTELLFPEGEWMYVQETH